MTKEELLKEAEEKYIERLKQDGYNVEYRSETYNDGYLDSAEPREKRITELEKENAELKESYCLRRCKHCEFLHENGNCLKVGGYFTAVDNKDCPILKDKVGLIKENAELKEQCSILADCNTCISACKTENIEMKNNLTKAKEIIKDLMSYSVQLCDCRHTVDFEKTREEAEQFLSEVEK